jgi:hypothetical protein
MVTLVCRHNHPTRASRQRRCQASQRSVIYVHKNIRYIEFDSLAVRWIELCAISGSLGSSVDSPPGGYIPGVAMPDLFALSLCDLYVVLVRAGHAETLSDDTAPVNTLAPRYRTRYLYGGRQ